MVEGTCQRCGGNGPAASPGDHGFDQLPPLQRFALDADSHFLLEDKPDER